MLDAQLFHQPQLVPNIEPSMTRTFTHTTRMWFTQSHQGYDEKDIIKTLAMLQT